MNKEYLSLFAIGGVQQSIDNARNPFYTQKKESDMAFVMVCGKKVYLDGEDTQESVNAKVDGAVQEFIREGNQSCFMVIG